MSKEFSFSQTPVLKRSRSRFDLSHKNLTSGNMGKLIPFYLQEVYPGDTFKLTANCVVRTSSPLVKPIMDNLFLDTYFFFVPSRLVFDDWQRVFGENMDSPWANSQEYEVPKLGSSSGNRTVKSGTVADYLGIPVGLIPANVDISVIPFRGFAKIWDDWFRDQNNVSPMHIQKKGFVSSEGLNDMPWAPNNYSGGLPNVAKMHDYFTTCLPSPQKGVASEIPLTVGKLPVKAVQGESVGASPTVNALEFKMSKNGSFVDLPANTMGSIGFNNSTVNPLSSPLPVLMTNSPSNASNNFGYLVPDNLWADGTNASGGVTVNDMRLAFQLQKMLERDARGGTRYVEYLLSHFGVSSGDARLQRSEFLGGKRTPLNINQVTQTSASTGQENLGEQGAYSLTFARARSTKGFVEHGFVFGVCCIRQFHTYQQGIEKFWTRTKRTDFYDPVFANIGEQPVYKSELYMGAGKTPFGYNEAWADLRYRPNKVTGQMRSGLSNSLDIWHLADKYENAPTLNAGFIEETPTYLDRALTVDSKTQDQFILDFYVQNIAYRELPTYSIPSLIDHN